MRFLKSRNLLWCYQQQIPRGREHSQFAEANQKLFTIDDETKKAKRSDDFQCIQKSTLSTGSNQNCF